MICVSLDPFKAPKPQFRNPLTLHKVRKSSLKRGWGFTVTFTLDLDLHTLGMLFFVCNYGSDVKLKPFLSHWCQFCFENKVIPSDPCCLFISVYLLFFFYPFKIIFAAFIRFNWMPTWSFILLALCSLLVTNHRLSFFMDSPLSLSAASGCSSFASACCLTVWIFDFTMAPLSIQAGVKYAKTLLPETLMRWVC